MKRRLNRNHVLVAGAIALSLFAMSIDEPMPTETEPTETEIIQWKEETSVEPLENVTVTEPIPGETEQTEEPEAPKEPTYISLGEFKLTAYCSCEECCGRWATDRPKDENGNEIVIGSEGTVLEPLRSIAVDTDVIPYGTEILIYDKVFIAQDTGGGVNGNHIDIYFENHEDAIAFGVQYAEVFLVEGGDE